MLRGGRAISILFVLFSVIASGGASPALEWDPWLNGFPYRKPVTISNSTGGALGDFQVKVTVGFASGKMQADFSDVRFTSSDGETLLGHWRESYTASSTADFWVNVPSIPVSGATVYLYYGNSSAGSASNGTNTFEFFDDFTGTLSKWTKHKNSNISIQSGYLVCGGGSTTSPYGHRILGSSATYTGFKDGVIDAKIFLATDSIAEIGFRGAFSANTGYKGRWDARAGQGMGLLKPPYSGWNFWTGSGPDGTAVPTGSWIAVKLEISGSKFNIWRAGTSFASSADSDYAAAGEISLQNHYGAWSRFDDVRVRKYASPEPAAAVGAEDRLVTIAGSAADWRWKIPVAGEKVRSGSAANWSWVTFQNDGNGITVPRGSAADWVWGP